MRLVLIAIIFLLIGIVISYFYNQNNVQSQNQDKQPSEVKTETKAHLTGLHIGGNLVQIAQDEIFINPCGGECTRPVTHLDKNTYPDLFKIYDEFTRIEAQGIHDISGKDFIFFTNNIPDHGGYAALYGIIVDPEAKSVVYTTPKELKSPLATFQILPSAGGILFNLNPYLFNNSCTSCRLGILETVAYNTKQKKYVSLNQRSISGFKTLLEQYEKASKDCFYEGKARTVDEVISLSGNDARCGDGNMGNKPFTADSGAITVGEFQNIKNQIQKIIAGSELSLAHY